MPEPRKKERAASERKQPKKPSEYRELVGLKAKLDAVIDFTTGHDGYDTREFFKKVFAREIQKAATVVDIKEDPDE